MNKPKILFTLLVILTLLSFVYRYREACLGKWLPSPHPGDIFQVLELAGKNRMELETVLKHYKAERDSSKFKAAEFLIRNMYLHGSPNISMENNLGLDLYDFKEYGENEVQKVIDSLQSLYGSLTFDDQGWQSDVHTVKSRFLIEQIDLAFEVWGKPWNKHVSFDQFCDYILPYRSHYEPLEEGWRAYYKDKFMPLLDTLTDNWNPVRVANLVNDSLGNTLGFRHVRMHFPRELSFREGLKMNGGMCEDLTNQTIYAMRSVGIPVVVDFTPYWPKINLGHQWLSLLLEDGTTIPFDGTYRNPDRDIRTASRPLAKAFRHTYSRQKNTLVSDGESRDSTPDFLLNENQRDVTEIYQDAIDIIIDVPNRNGEIGERAFLAVFNMGNWKPINWGQNQGNGLVSFNTLGRDIIYLPVSYTSRRIYPIAEVFLLQEEGGIEILKPDLENTLRLELDRFSLWGNGFPVKDDKLYTLFYWDNDWIKVGSNKAIQGKVIFERIPSGALYRLLPEYEPRARVFIMKDGEMLMY